jgi:hypothetical protein
LGSFRYSTHAPAVWDFLPGPDYGMVLMATDDFNERLDTKTDIDGRTWFDNSSQALVKSNSMLVQVAPNGQLDAQYVQACAGAPTNYNQLSHEMRLDHSSPDLDALTTATSIRAFPALNVTTTLGTVAPCTSTVNCARDTRRATYDAAAGNTIVRWHRAAGELELVYDLFDFVRERDPAASRSWPRSDPRRAPPAPRVRRGWASPRLAARVARSDAVRGVLSPMQRTRRRLAGRPPPASWRRFP